MLGGLDDKGQIDESAKGKEGRGLCPRLVEDLFETMDMCKARACGV